MADITDADVWETWESMYLKVTKLGNDIIGQSLKTNTTITRIVVVPRGGLYVVNILSRMLGFSGDQVLTMGITRYDRESPTLGGKFSIGQLPTPKLVKGQTILVPDEVHDSGETSQFAVDKLYAMGAAKVMTAVVHFKPGKDTTGRKPDFFIDQTNGWVHYPWETIDPGGSVYRLALRHNGHS